VLAVAGARWLAGLLRVLIRSREDNPDAARALEASVSTGAGVRAS
jgi:hypothetical protein